MFDRISIIMVAVGVAIMACALMAPVNAATVTTSTMAPTLDAYDIYNLNPQGNTTLQKWFSDVEHDGGQTFTPTQDLLLNSFSVQINAGSMNLNDNAPNEKVDLRLGTISRPGGTFTFTDIYSEVAVQTQDWNGGDWVTWTYDTPQPLTAGVEYGVITDAMNFGSWQNGGIAYRYRTGDLLANGSLINRGGEITNSDLVFVADLSAAAAVPEPASVAIWSLLGLGLTGFGYYRVRGKK